MPVKRILAILLFSSLAMAQATTPAAQTAPKTKAPAMAQSKPASPSTETAAKKAAPRPEEVAADAAVITIDGLCLNKPATAPDCKTVVTKAQFDHLLEAVNPPRPGQPNQIPPAQKRRFGDNYAKMLVLAVKAERENLQNNPRVKALENFAKMQALATEMARTVQENAAPTPADIQKYYEENTSKFQEYKLERLFIPMRGSDGKELDKPTVEALAAKLRDRAAAGEAFEKLEKEAYETLKLQTPPTTTMTVPEGSLPQSQKVVYSMKPGDVSQVLSEPTGFYVYKLVSKDRVPLEKVRDDISRMLQQEKAQAAMDTILKSSKTVLNEAYFGPATATPQPGMPTGVGQRPTAPRSPAPASGQTKPATPPQH